MSRPRQWPEFRRAAVTLIELLCAMGIIAVLATLLLGPAARALRNARNMQWADQSEAHANAVVQKLRDFLGDRQDFPSLSLEALEGLNVFPSAELRFLHDRRVTFVPVAGSDPDDKVFLSIRLESGFLTSSGYLTHTRGNLRPPR